MEAVPPALLKVVELVSESFELMLSSGLALQPAQISMLTDSHFDLINKKDALLILILQG